MIPVLCTGCPSYAFFSLTSCTAEKCIFQLTSSRAIQGSTARGAGPKEKLSIPLEAHDKAQLSEIFQVFFQKFKEL